MYNGLFACGDPQSSFGCFQHEHIIYQYIGGRSGGAGGASAPPTFRLGVLSTPKYS